MNAPAPPGFFARLALALQVLLDAALAARVRDATSHAPQLTAGSDDKASAPPQVAEKIVERIVEKVVEKPVERIVEKIVEVEKIVDHTRPPDEGALHLLSILQRDGRLVDFLREDIATFKDAEVGAAARLVHQGCSKALSTYFTLAPVRSEEEEARIVVDKGFDATAIRLAGNIKGEPPYTGRLTHAGWRAVDVKLPERPSFVDARIVAPAEVEIP